MTMKQLLHEEDCAVKEQFTNVIMWHLIFLFVCLLVTKPCFAMLPCVYRNAYIMARCVTCGSANRLPLGSAFTNPSEWSFMFTVMFAGLNKPGNYYCFLQTTVIWMQSTSNYLFCFILNALLWCDSNVKLELIHFSLFV